MLLVMLDQVIMKT